MSLDLDTSIDRPSPLRACLRPAAIWLGLALFLIGAIAFGSALADQSGSVQAFTGPMLLVLGVSLIGGGFTMEPTGFALDPEIAFTDRRRYFVAGVSALFVLFALVVAAIAVL